MLSSHNDQQGSSLSTEADEAYATEATIKNVVLQMQQGWVILARELWHFNEKKMWKSLGYRTLDEWLASPEIDLGRRTVFGLMETWRTMVIEKGVSAQDMEGVGISKLRETLPAVRRGLITPQEALADARTLSREDLRVRYENTNERVADHALEATTEPQWMICSLCGTRVQVNV